MNRSIQILGSMAAIALALGSGSCQEEKTPGPAKPETSFIGVGDLNGRVQIIGMTGVKLGEFCWITGYVSRAGSEKGSVDFLCDAVNGRKLDRPRELEMSIWNDFPAVPEVGKRVSCYGYERLEELGFTDAHRAGQEQQEARRAKLGLEAGPASSNEPHQFATRFYAFDIKDAAQP